MKGVYIIVFLLSVLISAISQTLLKISACKEYESKIKEYLNFKVILAYAIFFYIKSFDNFGISRSPTVHGTGA